VKRLLALTIVTLTIAAAPALAADVGSLADQAALRHYAVEQGAPVDVNAMEAMVAKLPAEPSFYFVALAVDPPEGADLVASDVLDQLATILNKSAAGTVIVIGPTDVGTVSSDFSDAQLSDALDVSLDTFDTSYVAGFQEFAEDLLSTSLSPTTQPTTATTQATAPVSSGSGGGSGALIFLLFIVGIGALVIFAIRRGKKSDAQVQQRRLSEARSEIQSQIDAVANQILELADQVQVASNDQATQYYRDASATFESVKETFDKAATLEELEGISSSLDRARWQLEAADAVTEGRPVPPEPEERRTACFFDPTHKGGTEEATITTPAGSQTVSVCHSCAERLRKGDAPTPRSVPVGGRKVPVPMAPTAHGGGGIDLSSVFQVIVAGMGAAAQYKTSRGRVMPSARSSATPRRSARTASRNPMGRVFPTEKPKRRSVGQERRQTKKAARKGRARRRRS
jgi:hypothetical protein